MLERVNVKNGALFTPHTNRPYVSYEMRLTIPPVIEKLCTG